MSRDPRTEPRVGDVWRHHSSQTDTTVTEADERWVTVRNSAGLVEYLTRARFRYAVSFCEFVGATREVSDG